MVGDRGLGSTFFGSDDIVQPLNPVVERTPRTSEQSSKTSTNYSTIKKPFTRSPDMF